MKSHSIRTTILLILGGCTVLLILALLLFSASLMNTLIKPKITEAFHRSDSAFILQIGRMNYSILNDRFDLDSVEINGTDGKIRGTMSAFSITGLAWISMLWRNGTLPEDFKSAKADVRDFAIRFTRSGYEYRAARLMLSVPDSEITVESIDIHPVQDDEKFFAHSTFRRTRSIFTASTFSVHAVPLIEAVTMNNYSARLVSMRDPVFDLLVNIDKPRMYDASRPKLPDEFLSSIAGFLKIDSLAVTNGRLRYGERYAVRSKPAVITFDDLTVTGKGITNDSTAVADVELTAEGRLMGSGSMKLHFTIPVHSTERSFRYSGSVDKLKLSTLNVFLETAEQVRIKSGFLHMAKFEITVVAGRAGGTVRTHYRDLEFVLIDKKTGSENGLVNVIASLIANTFTIRHTNMPDQAKKIKIGTVQYKQQQDDSPFQFTWFALRSGVKDVVGF